MKVNTMGNFYLPTNKSRSLAQTNHARKMVAKFAADRRAQTHCLKGHEYTPENTIWKTNGRRRCRTCKKAEDRLYRARQKALSL